MPRHALTGRSASPPATDSAPAIGLAWLVRLRWAFAVAEVVVALGATSFLAAEVDAGLVAMTVAVTVLTNVGLLARSKKGRPASRTLLAAVLVLDGTLLTVALRASGGAMNPFSVLYIVHVALAALLLDGSTTWMVAGTTCIGFGALFLGTSPHGGHHHDAHVGFELHLRGMLVAYALAAAFVGYFVHRVARALERREREMVELRDWAARAEKLSSLSTLAAGVAHELGTPLATIAVVAKELERAAGVVDRPIDCVALSSDARLVREQAERCRRIIAKMISDSGEAPGAPPRQATVDAIVERVRASLPEARARALESAVVPNGAFVVVPDEPLVQVLGNLVANAFDACTDADGYVAIRTTVDGDRVAFMVEDHGCGIPDEVRGRLGEPFFSLKGGRGMGLGLFLARTFADRVGGSLTVESRLGSGSTFVLEVPGGAR